MHPVSEMPIVEDAFIFLLYGFGYFIKTEVSIGVWAYFWVFDLIALVILSVSVPIPCIFVTISL